MDLRHSDLDGLNRLGALWKATPGAEFEAMLTTVDLTAWQDVIQYLRSLGMRENPQIVKMNICLSNDIRFTLEGAGAIQEYCRDNRIAGKPFVAMLKEAITDAEPVTLGAYSVKAKLKREIPLAADDERVKEALSRWDSLGKHFRNIQRFEFVAPGGVPVRFDVSLVRENAGRPARTFQEARVTGTTPRYEVEVELTASRATTGGDAAARHIVRGISWMLQGRQRSFVLVSNSAADIVRESIGQIFSSGSGSGSGSGARRNNSNRNRNRNQPELTFRFPGPQPVTLERRNIAINAEPGTPNLRQAPGGYNVTDKADGLRCLLHVTPNGRIFLIDMGGRVYATGREADKSIAGIVLDGEWIRRDRHGVTISHYYAFDILAGKSGDTSVVTLPFMVMGAMVGSKAAENTRQSVMSVMVAQLAVATQTVRSVPPSHNIQISTKSFRAAEAGSDNIFRDCAATVLDMARDMPYNTDGLIFTPNAAPLPLNRGTWDAQLKWKPAAENTIDFLVIVERERAKDGKPTGVEAIGTKYREDSGATVRFKTMRLFVGSSRAPAFTNPRTTVLDASIPLPTSLADTEGEWRESEFRPTDPHDPMASICYMPIGQGEGPLDTESTLIRAENGDVIQSDMIVEMAYHPERAPGWRWAPTRVRHDKTERWLAQQISGGRKSGTMNADWVASSIWNSIHNPVTQDAISTGIVDYCPAVPAILASGGGGGRRAPSRDALRLQCWHNFVNEQVKSRILLGQTLPSGGSLLDLAIGTGNDLPRWLAAGAGYVLGLSMTAANLNDPVSGAYRTLVNKMIILGGREAVPPMVFVQADAARRLSTGEAGVTADDQQLLQREIGRVGIGNFDLVLAPLVTGDMARDENTMGGFLTNVADTVKVGGYLVGYGFDGDALARLLRTENSVVGRDGQTDVWSITKRYGSGIGASVPPSASGLGLAVDVDFYAAGTTKTEFLVSWPYLQTRLTECGLDLLTAEECTGLGIAASTQMFSETIATATEKYEMTSAVLRYAQLHRWWVLVRRTDRRPVIVSAPVSAPVSAQIIPSIDIIELEPEASAAEPEASAAEPEASAKPEEPFVVNAATKKPDDRLGPEFTDWPRYLSLGIQHEISDLTDTGITYPSIDAAVASAKFQRTTAQPAMGPQLFSVKTSVIHQRRAAERAMLQAAGNDAAVQKSIDDETADIRIASGAAKMKTYKWNKDTWDAQKADVYRGYLQKRYDTDLRYHQIIDLINARNGQILFANGPEPTDLGVGVRIDGSIVRNDDPTKDNKVGQIMMSLK